MPFIEEETLHRIAESARQARAEFMGVGEMTVRRTADVAEICGTAGALGFINARFGQGGQVAPMGVPLNLLVALGGLGASWLGFAGRFNRDAEMMGAGALAGYAAQFGASYGASMKAHAGSLEITGADSPYQLGAHAGQGVELQGGKRYVVSEMG